jgi:hypothetical protein
MSKPLYGSSTNTQRYRDSKFMFFHYIHLRATLTGMNHIGSAIETAGEDDLQIQSSPTGRKMCGTIV